MAEKPPAGAGGGTQGSEPGKSRQSRRPRRQRDRGKTERGAPAAAAAGGGGEGAEDKAQQPPPQRSGRGAKSTAAGRAKQAPQAPSKQAPKPSQATRNKSEGASAPAKTSQAGQKGQQRQNGGNGKGAKAHRSQKVIYSGGRGGRRDGRRGKDGSAAGVDSDAGGYLVYDTSAGGGRRWVADPTGTAEDDERPSSRKPTEPKEVAKQAATKGQDRKPKARGSAGNPKDSNHRAVKGTPVALDMPAKAQPAPAASDEGEVDETKSVSTYSAGSGDRDVGEFAPSDSESEVDVDAEHEELATSDDERFPDVIDLVYRYHHRRVHADRRGRSAFAANSQVDPVAYIAEGDTPVYRDHDMDIDELFWKLQTLHALREEAEQVVKQAEASAAAALKAADQEDKVRQYQQYQYDFEREQAEATSNMRRTMGAAAQQTPAMLDSVAQDPTPAPVPVPSAPEFVDPAILAAVPARTPAREAGAHPSFLPVAASPHLQTQSPQADAAHFAGLIAGMGASPAAAPAVAVTAAAAPTTHAPPATTQASSAYDMSMWSGAPPQPGWGGPAAAGAYPYAVIPGYAVQYAPQWPQTQPGHAPAPPGFGSLTGHAEAATPGTGFAAGGMPGHHTATGAHLDPAQYSAYGMPMAPLPAPARLGMAAPPTPEHVSMMHGVGMAHRESAATSPAHMHGMRPAMSAPMSAAPSTAPGMSHGRLDPRSSYAASIASTTPSYAGLMATTSTVATSGGYAAASPPPAPRTRGYQAASEVPLHPGHHPGFVPADSATGQVLFAASPAPAHVGMGGSWGAGVPGAVAAQFQPTLPAGGVFPMVASNSTWAVGAPQ